MSKRDLIKCVEGTLWEKVALKGSLKGHLNELGERRSVCTGALLEHILPGEEIKEVIVMIRILVILGKGIANEV